jgi:hypothetical protein
MDTDPPAPDLPEPPEMETSAPVVPEPPINISFPPGAEFESPDLIATVAPADEADSPARMSTEPAEALLSPVDNITSPDSNCDVPDDTETCPLCDTPSDVDLTFSHDPPDKSKPPFGAETSTFPPTAPEPDNTEIEPPRELTPCVEPASMLTAPGLPDEESPVAMDTSPVSLLALEME